MKTKLHPQKELKQRIKISL